MSTPFKTQSGYSSTGKLLHWVIAILVLSQFVVSWLMPDVKMRMVSELVNLHLSIGILILAAMAIRFVHRLAHPVPIEMIGSPRWERVTALATHLAIYFILLVGPFLGWASASAHDVPVTFFGLVTLPALASPRARWALTAGDLHTYMMWTLLGLITLHVLAALYHHFVRHDGVLRRMLPHHA